MEDAKETRMFTDLFSLHQLAKGATKEHICTQSPPSPINTATWRTRRSHLDGNASSRSGAMLPGQTEAPLGVCWRAAPRAQPPTSNFEQSLQSPYTLQIFVAPNWALSFDNDCARKN
jgi:hypothetical protein